MIRPKTRAGISLAVSAVVALTATACGSASSAGDEAQLTLAWVGPLTGADANLGINSLNGAKVALDEANAAGGTKIAIKEFDTQGDPAQATTVKDQYVNDPKIIGVVGPTYSGETKAVLPDLQQNGLVMVSPSATNVLLPTIVPDETVFHRIMADDSSQGGALSRYILKILKPKKVFFVHDNTDYGRGLAEGTMKDVATAGVATGQDTIKPKEQDYSAAVNTVKAAKPDVVFYGGYYTDAGNLRKQLVDAGVKVPFLGGDGAFDPGFIAAGGANANGAEISCPCNLATETSAGALGDFARKYKALNNTEPGTYSTEGYDAAKILIEGIKAGNTTRDALLNYVERPDVVYDTLSKKVSFEPNGNVKSTAIFFFQVKDGKFVLTGSSEELLK